MMTKAKYIVCAAMALTMMSACGDFLEEYSQDEQHYKLLHAVIANKELRKKVFDI